MTASVHTRPKRARVALLEPADPRNPKLERVAFYPAQRVGEIFGDRAFHLADEAQGEVQLLLVLSAEIGAVVHRVEKKVTNAFGRADGDEQPVHML